MSYDLEFRPGTSPLDLAQVRAWLGGRANWTVENVSAVYQNDETGVYFVLDVHDPEPGAPALIALINLYRPSFFIREVDIEIRALVAAFGLTVFDPQNEETAPAGFDTAWLATRWESANRQAHEALATDHPKTLSVKRLAAAWSWNYQRQATQASYADDVFVPAIMAIGTPAGTSTAVVWTDAIPVILPEVGYVIIVRNRLAPRKLLRAAGPDIVLVGYEAVVDLLRPWAAVLVDRVEFRVPAIPPTVEQWVQRLPAQARAFQGIAWDQVHDTELLPGA